MNPSADPAVIHVVEDDAAVRDSLCALLRAHGQPARPSADAEAFLDGFDPAEPALMILDLRLPGMGGEALQAHLAEIAPALPVIVVTAHGDVPAAVRAMRAGAVDFIEKPASADCLLAAVRRARALVRGPAPAALPKAVLRARLGKLTPREREVLALLVEGRLNKEIGAALGISQRTVEVHRARIREKMQARGVADLIRMLG
jgi:FixJ family two-component response regulator